MNPVRAVALLSGGLDSTLAVRLLQEQGVEIKALHFYTGFCITEHKRRLGLKREDGQQYVNPALKAAAQLRVPLEVVDISEDYYRIVLNPKYGYGKNVNPCIDCRIHMLRKAKEIMERDGYHFVVTGEVLYQRPMSQTPQRLRLIERESGLEGYILRPLSAKVLPQTIPEIRGWVDRKRLLGIRGRSRKVQIALAQRFGLEYEQPAGGCCYLTDENYAERFREAFAVEGRISREDLVQGEVRFLKSLTGRYGYAMRRDGKGTLVLIKGTPAQEELQTIADIVARYSKREEAEVLLNTGREKLILTGRPVSDDFLEPLKIYHREGVAR